MSATVDEDFRSFVVARWPELEAAARVVVLDPAHARRVTTDALAQVASRWRESVESGRPGEEARRALLLAALAHGPRARPWSRPARPDAAPTAASPVVASALPWEDGAEAVDEGVRAVLEVLTEAEPLDRAIVAGRVVWELRSHEVAHLLERSHGELAGREHALEQRLAAARSRARSGAGLDPGGGWRGREHDVEDAVHELLRGLDDPPDPADLVAERSGRVRRRHVVLGGVAAVAVAGVGTALALRPDPAPPPPKPKPPPGPDDPVWARTASWPARGPLADDPRVMELMAMGSPFGSRVLWAGDVGTLRLVIACYPGSVDIDGTEVLVWSGARGQDLRTLQPVTLSLTGLYGVDDVVAVTVADGPDDAPRSLLVVLARPTVSTIALSRFIDPQPDATVLRDWTDVRLEDGLAATVLDTPLGPALRLRTIEGQELAPVSPQAPFAEIEGPTLTPEALTDGTVRLVASVTGVPAADLRTTVAVDETLPVSAFAPKGRSRVVVVRTKLPNGALLTSAAVSDVGSDTDAMLFRSAAPTSTDHLGDPLVTRVEDERAGVGRFVVVAPGAARVQLISTSPDGYPVSKVVRTGGRDASIVAVVNADTASSLRVIARDARGRTLFDGVPVEPMWLLGF